MQNNKDTKLNEELFDALLKVAAKEAFREEMEALPNSEELRKMYPRSGSIDRKMNALINRESKILKRKKFLRTFTRGVSGFVISIVVATLILMTVEASRNYILNLLIDVRTDHVAFDIGQESVGNGSDEVILAYMPDGFVLISRQELDALVTYVFVDDKDRQIIIQQHTIAGNFFLGVDHEHMNFITILLDEQEVHLFEAEDDHDHNVIVWTHENNSFSLSANIDLDELLHIVRKLIVK